MTSLSPDCSRCAGLCCVALPFERSSSFAFTKQAGSPCHHLTPGEACGIHDALLPSGMSGCVAYECFGAGQQVTQVQYGGRSWRDADVDASQMFAVLAVVRRLHEMLVLLPLDSALVPSITASASAPPAELLALDLGALSASVGTELRAHSAAVRGTGGASYAGADLVGRDLRTLQLARADLRGALLIAADLRGVVLDRTDLLGADLRDTDLSGADLSTTLFVTQPQLNAARGDGATVLPPGLARPVTWPVVEGDR